MQLFLALKVFNIYKRISRFFHVVAQGRTCVFVHCVGFSVVYCVFLFFSLHFDNICNAYIFPPDALIGFVLHQVCSQNKTAPPGKPGRAVIYFLAS